MYGPKPKKNPFDMLFKVPPLARLALWSTLILAAAAVWLQNKSYSFDETEIIRISQKHIGSQTFGQDHRTSFAAIAKELKKRHPKSGIIDVSDGQFQWIWTRVGGLVGASTILYSSSIEFVAFFGTSVDTTGMTPRCLANISATVVQGSIKVWSEGQTGGKRFIPGETARLSMGECSAIEIDSSSWMVVHGRGLPVTCLPPVFINFLLSLDIWSLVKWLRQISKALFSCFVYCL